MPGIGLEMDGAVQQAAHPGRQLGGWAGMRRLSREVAAGAAIAVR
jgi:hypothetical protein